MSKAYDPSARANTFQVKYRVSRTGDRWFIPYNDNESMSAQLAQCKDQVGKKTNGSTEAGVQVVA